MAAYQIGWDQSAGRSARSIAPDRHARDARAMSASRPIASTQWQRSETTRCANSVLTHCNKQHRYSITSSARASNVGGTSTPSALAVFKRHLNLSSDGHGGTIVTDPQHPPSLVGSAGNPVFAAQS